jgi:hypothetical protein
MLISLVGDMQPKCRRASGAKDFYRLPGVLLFLIYIDNITYPIFHGENPIWDDAQDIAKKFHPNAQYNFWSLIPILVEIDNSRSKTVLGIEYKSHQTMVEELVHQRLD